jgi:hypothetical protein
MNATSAFGATHSEYAKSPKERALFRFDTGSMTVGAAFAGY